jgi:hypothetical protein
VGGDQFDMEFGVQVAEGSELPPGDVSIGITPSGRALHTLHVGTYDKLGEAFDAVYAYAAHESIDVGTPGWEVYGDWTDDASRLETDVYVMLALSEPPSALSRARRPLRRREPRASMRVGRRKPSLLRSLALPWNTKGR